METVTDFIADCQALSPGNFFSANVKTHVGLTRVLTTTLPRKAENAAYEPLTSFGRQIIDDLAANYSFMYNGISTCEDAETTLAESLRVALQETPRDNSWPETASGRRITIFTLENVPVAVQKNIKARTSYVLAGSPKFNLIPRTIAKFQAPNMVYPPSRPDTVFHVPLEGSGGYFWHGRYATSAVSYDIREQLSSETARTREGLMLNHDHVVADVTRLLECAQLLRVDIAA